MTHNNVGNVLQTQGKLAEAQTAFGEYLTISRRLAEQDPSNAGGQRELAGRAQPCGQCASDSRKAGGGAAAFREYLAISRRLAEQDPSNAGLAAGLAVAHNRVGGVLQIRPAEGGASSL